MFSTSRRITATFSGSWARVGAVSASSGYLAGIDALTVGVSGYLTTNFTGRAFEKIDESYLPDSQDDTARYTVIYQELLVSDPGAGMGVLACLRLVPRWDQERAERAV